MIRKRHILASIVMIWLCTAVVPNAIAADASTTSPSVIGVVHRLGNLEVKVISVQLRKVSATNSAKHLKRQQMALAIDLEMCNTGRTDVKVESLSSGESPATLSDDQKAAIAAMILPDGYAMDGARSSAVYFSPQRKLVEHLAFEPPTASAASLTLALPARLTAGGTSPALAIQIPTADITSATDPMTRPG